MCNLRLVSYSLTNEKSFYIFHSVIFPFSAWRPSPPPRACGGLFSQVLVVRHPRAARHGRDREAIARALGSSDTGITATATTAVAHDSVLD